MKRHFPKSIIYGCWDNDDALLWANRIDREVLEDARSKLGEKCLSIPNNRCEGAADYWLDIGFVKTYEHWLCVDLYTKLFSKDYDGLDKIVRFLNLPLIPRE